jgi:hypothetical protein
MKITNRFREFVAAANPIVRLLGAFALGMIASVLALAVSHFITLPEGISWFEAILGVLIGISTVVCASMLYVGGGRR